MNSVLPDQITTLESYHPSHVSTASSPKTAFFGAKPTPLRLSLSHVRYQLIGPFPGHLTKEGIVL